MYLAEKKVYKYRLNRTRNEYIRRKLADIVGKMKKKRAEKVWTC